MSTSPMESVFGNPERLGDHRHDAAISDIATHRNSDAKDVPPAPAPRDVEPRSSGPTPNSTRS